MNEPKNLSQAALEEALNKLWGEALERSMQPLDLIQQMDDAVKHGTGMVQWSAVNDPESWNFVPKWIRVHPRNFWLAQKVLRGSDWHYKNTARWRYLVRRGARK